jgi:hypothetical protein
MIRLTPRNDDAADDLTAGRLMAEFALGNVPPEELAQIDEDSWLHGYATAWVDLISRPVREGLQLKPTPGSQAGAEGHA